MSKWDEPCKHDGPSHDFEPLHITPDGRYHITFVAVCRKCGVLR